MQCAAGGLSRIMTGMRSLRGGDPRQQAAALGRVANETCRNRRWDTPQAGSLQDRVEKSHERRVWLGGRPLYG
jgi:hypothetical protein